MSLLVVHVHVRVNPESVGAFLEATLRNAERSREEPGVVRFDVIEQEGEVGSFVLVEVYRDAAATGAHKATAHYAEWRDAVAGMMAEPRRSVRYTSVSPEASGW